MLGAIFTFLIILVVGFMVVYYFGVLFHVIKVPYGYSGP